MLYNSHKDMLRMSLCIFFWYQLTRIVLDKGPLNRLLLFYFTGYLSVCKMPRSHNGKKVVGSFISSSCYNSPPILSRMLHRVPKYEGVMWS